MSEYDSDLVKEDQRLHFMESSVTSAAFLANAINIMKRLPSIEIIELDYVPNVVIVLQGD